MSDNAVESVAAACANGKLTPSARDNLTRWLTDPVFAEYREMLLAYVRDERFDELDRAFWEVIPFGTGGRRGQMGNFGTATINDRTIRESASGLAAYARNVYGDEPLRAVIARDTRIRSDDFARLTAEVFAAYEFEVFFFDEYRSTPELSFAVRHLECHVGAMISASHNPPSDNGFKAYWSNGAQVLPPHDNGIIDCVYAAGEIPSIPFEQAVNDGKIKIIGTEVDEAYLSAAMKLSLSDARDVQGIFSSLHGVGETNVFRVLERLGFEGIRIFEPHREPEGSFPNVPDHLPNPERSQVFDPILEIADPDQTDIIIASDPDADRLGVCARDKDGRFVHLSGNQVGALITDYILAKRQAAGTLDAECYVVETLVTTPLVGAIAESYGVKIVDDLLVGFKYIAQTMDRLGPDKFVLGIEESLGYLSGQYARDKDAAVAGLYVSELASELKRDGRTLIDHLDDLYVRHGYYLEGQKSQVLTGSSGQAQIGEIMDTLRTAPPTELAGLRFSRVRDYQSHEIRRLPENAKVSELPEPQGNILFFEAEGDGCAIGLAVRPSGTEPKIKYYFFARTIGPVADLEQTKATLTAGSTDFQTALLDWVSALVD